MFPLVHSFSPLSSLHIGRSVGSPLEPKKYKKFMFLGVVKDSPVKSLLMIKINRKDFIEHCKKMKCSYLSV